MGELGHEQPVYATVDLSHCQVRVARYATHPHIELLRTICRVEVAVGANVGLVAALRGGISFN